jgi:hypothetical protein
MGRKKKSYENQRVGYNPDTAMSYVDTSGYTHIKGEAGIWRLEHRVIWAKANGIVPDGYIVKFIDGNKKNVTLENLRLVPKKGFKKDSITELQLKITELEKTISELMDENANLWALLKN